MSTTETGSSSVANDFAAELIAASEMKMTEWAKADAKSAPAATPPVEDKAPVDATTPDDGAAEAAEGKPIADEAAEGDDLAEMAELDQEGLEVDPGQRGVAQARLRLLEGEEIAQEVRGGGLGGLGPEGFEPVGAEREQVPGHLDGADDEEGPEVLDELAEDEPEIVSGGDDALDQAEHLLGLLVENGRGEAEEEVLADGSQDRLEVLVPDVLPSEGHGLVEEVLGVPHAAVGRLGDQGQAGRGDRDPLFLGDLWQG